jgi:hypothetical protein
MSDEPEVDLFAAMVSHSAPPPVRADAADPEHVYSPEGSRILRAQGFDVRN